MTTPEILSIIAIVMSSVTLSWQVVSWWRTGAVVTVTAHSGLVGGERGDVGGEPDDHVVIEATNSGRTAVTVMNLGFQFPNGAGSIRPELLSNSTEIPHRLEPGAQGSWIMSLEGLTSFCDQQGMRHQEMVAWVKLGNGKTVSAKRKGVGLFS